MPHRIVEVDPRSDSRWLALSRGPTGSLFTSPPWVAALCDTYGFTPRGRLLVDDEDTVLAGFSWVPVDDIRGTRLLSLPFCDRADPMVTDERAWALLRQSVPADDPLSLRCLDTNVAARDPSLVHAGAAAWHGTPLHGGVDELRGRLSSAARRNINAAQRNGIRVEGSTGLDAVRAFHRLHVHLRKHKYRLLAQPLEFFERVWKAFAESDDVVVLLAVVDDQVIAGGMYLRWVDTLYYKFGASLPEYLGLRPNDALAWAALRWASERDLRLLDWGLSDLDQPGLIAYKRKWASDEGRIVTLRSGGATVPRPAVDRMLGELTRLFTEDSVPDDVSTRAGALLYRHFC